MSAESDSYTLCCQLTLIIVTPLFSEAAKTHRNIYSLYTIILAAVFVDLSWNIMTAVVNLV